MIATATEVRIDAGDVSLDGELLIPSGADGVVLFAHGSGSSRASPRNVHVARLLRKRGLGTLLFDLLTLDEERMDAESAAYRFDVALLAARLAAATEWLARQSGAPARLGYFGASTGAAAALIAAAHLPHLVHAVVSRGGRPDLAADALPRVRAPTLLLVGGADEAVLDLNESALRRLRCEKELAIIPGATHLFQEPGALDMVANRAGQWFARHLQAERAS